MKTILKTRSQIIYSSIFYAFTIIRTNRHEYIEQNDVKYDIVEIFFWDNRTQIKLKIQLYAYL